MSRRTRRYFACWGSARSVEGSYFRLSLRRLHFRLETCTISYHFYTFFYYFDSSTAGVGTQQLLDTHLYISSLAVALYFASADTHLARRSDRIFPSSSSSSAFLRSCSISTPLSSAPLFCIAIYLYHHVLVTLSIRLLLLFPAFNFDIVLCLRHTTCTT